MQKIVVIMNENYHRQHIWRKKEIKQLQKEKIELYYDIEMTYFRVSTMQYIPPNSWPDIFLLHRDMGKIVSDT